MGLSSRLRSYARSAYDWLQKASSLPVENDALARSAVVFAPHPDDETLGCGGTIARKRQQGADVTVVFVTDGRGSHRDLMSGEDLARLRRQEARSACAALGVDDAHIVWLGIPNGDLVAQRASALRSVRTIIDQRRPAEVFVPYRHEPPLEHRGTREIVLRALSGPGDACTVYEYPIWFWNTWPWVSIRWRPYRRIPARIRTAALAAPRATRHLRYYVNIRGVWSAKQRALGEHRSQMRRLMDTPDWHTLADVAGGDFLTALSRDRELFHRYECLGPADRAATDKRSQAP